MQYVIHFPIQYENLSECRSQVALFLLYMPVIAAPLQALAVLGRYLHTLSTKVPMYVVFIPQASYWLAFQCTISLSEALRSPHGYVRLLTRERFDIVIDH